MTDKPMLLFLHGVGDGDPEDNWREALNEALIHVGYSEGLTGIEVIAPKYPMTLKHPSDEKVPLPPIRTDTLSGRDAGIRDRQRYRQLNSLELRIGLNQPKAWVPKFRPVIDVAMQQAPFEQAKRYVSDEQTRARVLTRALSLIPDRGRLVIIAHSLGSVIAADILRRLSPDLHIEGLVTIGSPLGNPQFHVPKLRSTMKSHPANLDWWVNFWSATDIVTESRGLSSVSRWILDRRVATSKLVGLSAHAAVQYLQVPEVATTIGFALHGSASREIVKLSSSFDVPPDDAEKLAIVGLTYAHEIHDQLKGDTRARFWDALRENQARTVGNLIQRRQDEHPGLPLPTAVTELGVDLSDPTAEPPRPGTMIRAELEASIVPLLSVLFSNVTAPYEIDLPDEARSEALKFTAARMGLLSKAGQYAFESAEEAKSILKDGRSPLSWALIGLGAAVVLGASGGLAALIAAPGLAGAAAITSALATFGPGGMLGGLLTAGTLVTTGTGTFAAGIASISTSAQAAEEAFSIQLAAVILRERLELPPDPNSWIGFQEAAEAIETTLQHHRAISDTSSATVKDLERKLRTAQRAINYMEKFRPTAEPLAIISGPESDD